MEDGRWEMVDGKEFDSRKLPQPARLYHLPSTIYHLPSRESARHRDHGREPCASGALFEAHVAELHFDAFRHLARGPERKTRPDEDPADALVRARFCHTRCRVVPGSGCRL